jgi:hypothetical protein
MPTIEIKNHGGFCTHFALGKIYQIRQTTKSPMKKIPIRRDFISVVSVSETEPAGK